MSWREVKVGVKPVFITYVSDQFFSGRPLSMKEIKRRTEEEILKVRAMLKKEAELLKPEILESVEDISKVKETIALTDLILVIRSSRLDQNLVDMLGKLGKPVAKVGSGVEVLDICAYLRSRGMEAYAPLDYSELNDLIHLLKVRKALSFTKVLIFTSTQPPSPGVLSSSWNLEEISRRFGVHAEVLSTEGIFEEVERVDTEKAEELTARMIKEGEAIRVKRENITEAVRMYLALKSLLVRYKANSLTINCGEPIFRKKTKIVPCIPFTLLNDVGIPAACEADLSVLLAMILLMYFSDKSVSMGNLWIHDSEKNLVRISHCVPGLRMRGFDEPQLSYILHDYHDRGYGATIYAEMDEGQEITIARFNPHLDRILAAKGEIVGCHNGISCRVTIDVKVQDARKLLHRAADYGHHYAVVYGEYTDELAKFGDMLKLKIEAIQ